MLWVLIRLPAALNREICQEYTLKKGNIATYRIKEGRRWGGLNRDMYPKGREPKGFSGSKPEIHCKKMHLKVTAQEWLQWGPYERASEMCFTEERNISGTMALCEKPREYSAVYCLNIIIYIIKLVTQLTIRSLRGKVKDIFIHSILNSISWPQRMMVLL